MRAKAFFNTPRKLMLPGAVIGADCRHFNISVPSWRLALDDEGQLFQDVLVSNWTKERDLAETRHQVEKRVGVEAALHLLIEAEEVGFESFADRYDAGFEGASFYTLGVRFGEMEKVVEFRGSEWMDFNDYTARSDYLQMAGFLKLWRAVHEFAPFSQAGQR